MTDTAPAKTFQDYVDEMVANPTLDEFFDRNPNTLSDEMLRAKIEAERLRRAEFVRKDSGQ